MAYSKKDITKALETISAPGEGKSLIESGAVKNIVTFDKEIIVDGSDNSSMNLVEIPDERVLYATAQDEY